MFSFTRQDLIDELYIQRDNAETVEEWEEISYHINQLEQELNIEEEFA